MKHLVIAGLLVGQAVAATTADWAQVGEGETLVRRSGQTSYYVTEEAPEADGQISLAVASYFEGERTVKTASGTCQEDTWKVLGWTSSMSADGNWRKVPNVAHERKPVACPDLALESRGAGEPAARAQAYVSSVSLSDAGRTQAEVELPVPAPAEADTVLRAHGYEHRYRSQVAWSADGAVDEQFASVFIGKRILKTGKGGCIRETTELEAVREFTFQGYQLELPAVAIRRSSIDCAD